MTLTKNAKFAFKWCSCGRVKRGSEWRKHIKESGSDGQAHSLAWQAIACTLCEQWTVELGSEAFLSRHKECGQLKITGEKVRAFLARIRQTSARAVEEEQAEESVDDEEVLPQLSESETSESESEQEQAVERGERREREGEAAASEEAREAVVAIAPAEDLGQALANIFGSDLDQMSDDDDFCHLSSSPQGEEARKKAEEEERKKAEEERKKVEEEERKKAEEERKKKKEEEKKRRYEALHRQNRLWDGDAAKKAISQAGAHQLLLGKYEALKRDHERLQQRLSEVSAKEGILKALKADNLSLQERWRKAGDGMAEAEARAKGHQARVVMLTEDCQRLKAEVEEERKLRKASEAKAADERARLEEQMASLNRMEVHLPCIQGHLADQPLLVNSLDSTIECFRDEEKGVDYHHLFLSTDPETGDLRMRASRTRKRPTGKFKPE